VGLFVAYTVRISRAPAEEPHLVGPARWIGGFSVAGRRAAVLGLFVIAAGIILLCAEHFADALRETGASFGISEFLLVQWLAPLASEAPELLVAGLFAWRLNTNAALGTLVSSKVNQWTLLVGTLPIAFAIAAGGLDGLPIVGQQREELFLTAAQSAFAVVVLINLTLSVREAGYLLGLFLVQFVAGVVGPESIHDEVRIITGVAYLLLALGMLVRNRREVRPLMRDGLRTPYAEMT
jgi:cation:H+ antiporter